VRCGKEMGLRNLPFREFAPNEVWLELSLIAQDLIAWTRPLSLEGELSRAEPKRLRYGESDVRRTAAALHLTC
jgi:hypothetical protein